MLGEIVVHGEDIRHPLCLPSTVSEEALSACLDMYKGASFPVGTKRRIASLRLVASDVDWAHGPAGVAGTASMLLVMTGRAAALNELSGEGVATLRARMEPARLKQVPSGGAISHRVGGRTTRGSSTYTKNGRSGSTPAARPSGVPKLKKPKPSLGA